MWERRWWLAVLAIWTILAHGRGTGSEGGVNPRPGRNTVAIKNPSGWREAKDDEGADGNRPVFAAAGPEASDGSLARVDPVFRPCLGGKNSVNDHLASGSPESGASEIGLLVAKSEETKFGIRTSSDSREAERKASASPWAEEETGKRDEELDETSRRVLGSKPASVDQDITVEMSGKEERKRSSPRDRLKKGVGDPRQLGSIKGRLFGANREDKTSKPGSFLEREEGSGGEERRGSSGAFPLELVKLADNFSIDNRSTTIENLVSGTRGKIDSPNPDDLWTRNESSTATPMSMIAAPGALRARDPEEGWSSTRVNNSLQGRRDLAITRGTKSEASAEINRCLPRGVGSCIEEATEIVDPKTGDVERRNGGSGLTGSDVGPSSAVDVSTEGKRDGKLKGGKGEANLDQKFLTTRHEMTPELSEKVFLAEGGGSLESEEETKAWDEIGVSRPDAGGGKQAEMTPGISLIVRLGDKYLASKKKRGMRESSYGPQKTGGGSAGTIYPGEVARDEEYGLVPPDAESTFYPGPMPEVAESNEPLLSPIFISQNETTTTTTEGVVGQVGQLFTEKEDGDEYYSRTYGDSTEATSPEVPGLLGDFATPASVTSGLPEQGLLPVGIEGPFRTTENSAEFENSSRSTAALNQWPVKHSAVVEGDLVLGGLMMVHEREDSVTCGPVMPQGGVQALEAMLYTLDRLNSNGGILPGVKIGAHILDDCDKDTYGLEMAVDFIKGSISNIDGAEYHCNKTAVRKVISGVVGAASSVTSIQVANLLRLFRIPQVSFFSTSPELSNKQRFEYFSRTIPSDHYQVKAMVDIVRKMNWSYVSIIYEESNYGIKAFEELEDLLSKYDICIAIKEKLVKDSGVAEETAYDNIVQKLLTKPRARGCIIFGSDQEVAGVMRAVRRCNATGAFSWIGSDGWSARDLVSNGNEAEVEGTLSVQPQANPVKGFEEYFLNLTVENNRRNPWFVEFWEDHFKCRYPNASWTPHNVKYTNACTTEERLTKQNTAFEDQLQFVSDAVMAFAWAFRDMHEDLCQGKSGLCDAMKPTKGTELLRYLRKVNFTGLSGDEFRFDKNGDGPARYNIIHFKQASPGKYKWVRVGEYMEGELRLNMSEIQFRLGHPLPPESVCSLPCEVGQAKKYVEGESCCWHCFNCTQYQVRHPLDETQCIPCPKGTVPDETHSTCRDIPEEFLRPESGWAIGAMSFSATGILVTLFVGGVFLRHNDTPVVKASGRELSYVLLTGILLCYLVTFALVLRPNDIVCGIQRFGAGFCFTVVYAALLTKTNRISRIFDASKKTAKRPSFISPKSQLIICSGLMSVQVLVNGIWMIIDPARAMHHYPTREDNLLVCSSYIDASYMIAFTYPIILIVVCTVYAVLTRKIPASFNESKHIGFTMYTTCVIWLAFVPLYFGTGNHVALRITSMSVTISLSASVTIACLFSPKLYIILIRPDRNVRQSMMPARYSTTKNSAVTGTNASSMMAAVTLTAATCDQNKAVKRHVTTTIDCSTQSECYEMEVREDRINGKVQPSFVSRSTQTESSPSSMDQEFASTTSSGAAAAKDLICAITPKEIIGKDQSRTATIRQIQNNVRIGNGPVSQKDGPL